MSQEDEFSARLMQAILRAHPLEVNTQRKMVHISDIGKCIRQTYYKYSYTPIDETRIDSNAISTFIFDFGNMFESVIHQRLIWAGYAPVKLRAESLELNAVGETDDGFIFEGQKIVTESKATNRRHYEKIVRGLKTGVVLSELVETYYPQIQGYLWSLPQLDHGEILVGNRDMSYDDVLPPLLSIRVDRDKEWFEDSKTRMSKLKTALETKVPPAREYAPTSWQCAKACPYFDRCYGSADASELNNESSTISGR